MRYVYLLESFYENEYVYKIGVAKNVEQRIKQFRTGNTNSIELKNKFLSKYPFVLEKTLHRYFSIENLKNEWFFLNKQQVDEFISNCERIEKGLLVVFDKNDID